MYPRVQEIDTAEPISKLKSVHPIKVVPFSSCQWHLSRMTLKVSVIGAHQQDKISRVIRKSGSEENSKRNCCKLALLAKSAEKTAHAFMFINENLNCFFVRFFRLGRETTRELDALIIMQKENEL